MEALHASLLQPPKRYYLPLPLVYRHVTLYRSTIELTNENENDFP